MCGQILRPKAKAAAQTRYFPRYPNYKNASINMFNAGYPADKARPAPCDLNGPRAGHALREEGRKGLAAAPRRRWHRSRAWCVRPAGRRADSGPRGARQSTNAVEMWYSKCVKQRILALAARFSYTCGAPGPRPRPRAAERQAAAAARARALAVPQTRGACKPRRRPGPTARPARRADTDNGNSGGPVWVAQDGKRYLIGIHVAGGTSLNYGTRISTRVEAFIVNAMAKGG